MRRTVVIIGLVALAAGVVAYKSLVVPYDPNVPDVQVFPESTVIDSTTNPSAAFDEEVVHMVMALPEYGKAYLWPDNAAYKAYASQLRQHGWKAQPFIYSCIYKKYTHDDTVGGPGWTLSLSDESKPDGSYRITAVVTRGYNTGPQACGEFG